MIQSQYFIFDVFCSMSFIFIQVSFGLYSLTLCFIRVKFCLGLRFRWWVILLLYCRLRLLKCRRDVITAVLHSVGMKHRSLASASENACAWSGERFLFERAVVQGRLKLPFRKCCIFFVFYLLLCVAIWASLNLSRIASFKRSWELLTGVSTCLHDLSITLKLKREDWIRPNRFFTILAEIFCKTQKVLFYF